MWRGSGRSDAKNANLYGPSRSTVGIQVLRKPHGQLYYRLCWILPRLAIFPAEKLIGFVVADDELFFAIPFEAAAELHGEHPQQAHVGRAMGDFDVALGTA